MSAVQYVAVVCCVFLSTCSALDPHQLELKQHYEHLAYIADFPCLHPQPRVIPVHKLFSEGQSHGKAYFPDVTVLHRCDEYTGSCTSGHGCTAKTTELVLLPFKATYLHDSGKHKQGAWQMEYHELLNHTQCACAVAEPHDSCGSNAVDTLQKRNPSEEYQAQGPSSTPSVYDVISSSRRPDNMDSFSSSSGSSGSTPETTADSTTRDYLSELFERKSS